MSEVRRGADDYSEAVLVRISIKSVSKPRGPGELSPDFANTYATAPGYGGYAPAYPAVFDGDKFPGGFGPTQLLQADYWTLRERSGELFRNNLYAKGLVRRLITNEINTGLSPESCPDEQVLGVPEGSLDDWSELVESRFNVWATAPTLCDYELQRTFGELQELIRLEALIEGDCLVILRSSQVTKLPMVQVVRGNRVRTPFPVSVRKGHKVVEGVELDPRNRQVAYWVLQDDGSSKRVPAWGEKSGRRISWLHYGCERRAEEIRGDSLLGVVLQSLKEVDRYRDSAQRKAVINSIMAMFIKKTEERAGSLAMTAGAVRADTATTGDTTPRTIQAQGFLPGMVAETLQFGEEPVLLGGQGTDVNFGVFEEAIIQGVAWANEVPPEILRLAFSNNYSASQAAINEYKIYLNKRWKRTGDTICTPIYTDWMLSEVLIGKLDAPGLLESWKNPEKYDTFGAITMVDWYGSIKPSTDMLKAAKASEVLVRNCWSTNAREARGLTGTKWRRNARKVKRETEIKLEVNAPLMEAQEAERAETEAVALLEERVDIMLEERGIVERV